jgi:transcriptional regulator with XRE-family HTH domain
MIPAYAISWYDAGSLSGRQFMTSFGEYLKVLREHAGLSQEALAEAAQISSAYVSQLETGRRNPPTPDVLRQMAAPLGVSYIVLLKQAGYLSETELQLLLLRAIKALFAQGEGRAALVALLREAIDRWLALEESARQTVLDTSSADHVAEIILEGLLQRQVDLLFSELFEEGEVTERGDF